MARRAARAPKVSSELKAARSWLGLVQNSAGQWVRPNEAQATRLISKQLASSGYQANPSAAPGSTLGIVNKRGQTMGTFQHLTGEFSLTGGKGKGAGKGKGKGKGTGRNKPRGGTAAGEETPTSRSRVYAEADTAATSLIRAQGKAYAAARERISGTALGATGGGEEIEGTAGTTKRPRRRRGMLKKKGRGPNFSVRQGKVRKTGRPKNPR